MLESNDTSEEHALRAEIMRLQQELEAVREDKIDLEIILDLTTEHSDTLEAMLERKARSFLQEKLDLEILLETATEHTDALTSSLRDKAEAALRESERRLAKFMEAVPVGVYVISGDGKPYYANQTALQILNKTALPQGSKLDASDYAKQMARDILDRALGLSPISTNEEDHEAQQWFNQDLLSMSNPRLAGTDQPYPIECRPLFRALQGERATVDDMEIDCDGKIVPLEVWATPIFSEDGTVLYAIAVFQDITHRKHAEAERLRYIREKEAKNAALQMNAQLQAEIYERQKAEAALQELNRQLARLVNLDGLTQVANRRHLDEYLMQMWRQMARDQSPLAIIMCDVDYFKRYNDTYGHLAGDDCLQKVAQTMQQCARRPADLAARYGGEEFVLVLPNTDIEGALQVAKQFSEALYELKIPHAGSEVSCYVTVSLGVSCSVPRPENNPQTLIHAADRALYEAKHQGRNRIVVGD